MAKWFWIAAVAVTVSAAKHADAAGGGRWIHGGHPYHNGYYFIPPTSAYQSVTVRPPFQYGAPSYYYPGSYLPPAMAVYPAATYPDMDPRPWTGYYISSYGYVTTYQW